MNFCSVSASHEQQFFKNCSSMDPYNLIRPSVMGCFSMSLPWGHRSCQNTCSSVGSSPRSYKSCQEPAPELGLHGLQPPPAHICLLWGGVLHGLQVAICSTVDLHGLQEDNLFYHGLHHGLRGNLCSGDWGPSSSSFFLVVCRVVSPTYSHSSLPAAVA